MSTELTKRQFALQLWRSQGGPFTVLWRTLSELVQRPFYPIYERMLMASAETWHRPQHIGIIMDGNRRFARQIGASNVAFGHQVGADKLREMLDWCFEREIPVVTVWGFSLDNFHRDTEEVQQLLELFERKT
ncbi:MAG TPA: undecaprenyl diphosphate synthase family protein, partial [Polyangiales bacterium]